MHEEPDFQSQRDAVAAKFEAEHVRWDQQYGESDYDSAGFQWRQAGGIRLCIDQVPAGGHILDAGCGAGHALVKLAELGYEVTGLDIAASMISTARANAQAAGVSDRCRFAVGDIVDVDPEGSRFDGILGLGFIEYFDDPVSTLSTCRDLLTDHGVVVMQFWNRAPFSDVVAGVAAVSRRVLLHPIRTLRTRLWQMRHRSAAAHGAGSVIGDVVHLRYSPRQVAKMASSAGLVAAATSGSRWFGHGSRLGDRAKLRWERRLQQVARRIPWLNRLAIDYVVAFRRAGTGITG